MDKELVLLNAVENSAQSSQRELAKRTGLSLGIINILIRKMIREGFIKLEKIPTNRLTYMLTPMGIDEKLRKTQIYIQYHYLAMERMRQQLHVLAKELKSIEGIILLDITQSELRSIFLQTAVENDVHLTENSNNAVAVVTDSFTRKCEDDIKVYYVFDYLSL